VPALVLALAACGSPVETAGPAAATIPRGWSTVQTTTHELELTLPPWLGVFDNVGAIFANEPPAPGGSIETQLMASGPGPDQPDRGEDLVAWLDRKLADTGSGIPRITSVALPAGAALRYERVDRAGTPLEWHLVAWVIATPTGFAYLQIDGSPNGWRRHVGDFDTIAALLRSR
jgi:hypothetical protein